MIMGNEKTYKTEVHSRWGNTDAYREYAQKTKNYTKDKWAEVNEGPFAIFAAFASVAISQHFKLQ